MKIELFLFMKFNKPIVLKINIYVNKHLQFHRFKIQKIFLIYIDCKIEVLHYILTF